ncbi:hypothetical protein APY94_11125 [Thermococcus celericrescens]|uniref:Uncharacterized protein n=1 Tax=Thermococcus celericrescens TaxID=227598 RepID=A0A100XW02_9EURY|nr:hypothetical protein [Thermococcus celericrescens]KUH32059.1 hypothetical protein APY94_11125 [Thermococcus celericrescens]
MEPIVSRLKLLSVRPFYNYDLYVHSGEAIFLVEPVGKTIVAFIPDSRDVRKLVGRENSYVDVVIDPLYSEVVGPADTEKPLILEEPKVRKFGSSTYRLIGRFRKIEGDCGVFECGNLRFQECFSGEARWIELKNVRFYGYLPETYWRMLREASRLIKEEE